MDTMEQKQIYTMSYYKVDSKPTCSQDKEPFKTIPDCLRYYYKKNPDCKAFIFVHTNGSREAVTFKSIYENANVMAKSFIKLGVKRSEVVAVSLRDCPEWLYVVYGAMMAGARPISLSLTYTDGSDVIAMMKRLETCSAIFLDPGVNGENWRIFDSFISYHDNNGIVKSDTMSFLRYLIICNEKLSENENVLTVNEMLDWKPSEVDLPELDADGIALL